MVFNELREAIVTRLKEAMPKEVDVAGHPGVIDTAELCHNTQPCLTPFPPDGNFYPGR